MLMRDDIFDAGLHFGDNSRRAVSAHRWGFGTRGTVVEATRSGARRSPLRRRSELAA
jgi:hypothetical protein